MLLVNVYAGIDPSGETEKGWQIRDGAEKRDAARDTLPAWIFLLDQIRLQAPLPHPQPALPS